MDELAGDGGALLPIRRTSDGFIRADESDRADMGGVGEGAGVERTEPASLHPLLLPCVAR